MCLCLKSAVVAKRIGWAGIAIALLATGMVRGLPRSAAGSGFKKEGVAVFIIENEITKMQEALRDKGYYLGKVDGLFGLRTRASIRAYQKAENFPITGQVDSRTAEGFGVRPESTWDNPNSAGRDVGHGCDRAGGEMNRDKPSAGIRRAARANKTLRQQAGLANFKL
jgi:peptidoglycan hydrolase-like protein with peptidoglycan-binding domain